MWISTIYQITMLTNKAFIGLVSLGASFLVNVLAQDASQGGLIWDKASTSRHLIAC